MKVAWTSLAASVACASAVHAQGPSQALQQAVIQAAEAAASAAAQASVAPPAASNSAIGASAPAPVRKLTWIGVPRVNGRLQAADIGVVINTEDPLSVQVGEYYVRARHLKAKQVLRVSLPVRPSMTLEEFEGLRAAIDKHFGSSTQALALAWTVPYTVACNSITGALALGIDADLCNRNCASTRPSPYFNSASTRPLKDHGLRLSMLLAARSFKDAKALIDRGVAADGVLAVRGRPTVNALMLTTDDVPRRVRMPLYPPPGMSRPLNLDIRIEPESALQTVPQVLMAITGSVQPKLSPAPDWVPGGLGDHLTSYGGDLLGGHGQGTILEWLESGATASHGTVTEPCNHVQKFPHPQVLLLHYAQGSSAIEAYWKSVAWPQQSLFVGEPLASPFAGVVPAAPPPTQFTAPRLLP